MDFIMWRKVKVFVRPDESNKHNMTIRLASTVCAPHLPLSGQTILTLAIIFTPNFPVSKKYHGKMEFLKFVPNIKYMTFYITRLTPIEKLSPSQSWHRNQDCGVASSPFFDLGNRQIPTTDRKILEINFQH